MQPTATRALDASTSSRYDDIMALEAISVRFHPDDIWRIDESAKKMGCSRGECLRVCILLGITQLDGIESELAKPAASEDQLNLFRDLLTDPTHLVGDPGEA